MQHLIEFTAFTPDDGETRGVATVTSTIDSEGRTVVPFAQLAVIPGFVEGGVLYGHDGDPRLRPTLLGPGTDAPGHPDWCRTHDDKGNDGRSICFGETTRIGDTSIELTQPTGTPITVWYQVESADGGEELTPTEAREQAAELREIAAKLDALADVAEAGSAATR